MEKKPEPTMFPTGVLPAWLNSAKANVRYVTKAQHDLAHLTLIRNERLLRNMVNPGTTSVRAIRNILTKGDCP